MDSIHFICPKDFKSGKYFFSKYRIIDLVILIGGAITGLIISLLLFQIAIALKSIVFAITILFLGGIMIGILFILVTKISYYHNILEWMFVLFEYLTRKKAYSWKGIIYTDEDLL